MTLNSGQIEFINDEYINIGNFKLSQFVIPFYYEPLTYTTRRKYFEPNLCNPWAKSNVGL